MKQKGRTDRSPLGSVHSWCVEQLGWGIASLSFVCFTMSSRFSAQDYDDRPLSSARSLLDLSQSSHNTHRSRARSGSLGAEDPAIASYGERSKSMRIDTDLTVRIINIYMCHTVHTVFISTTDLWVHLPSFLL